jgi:hypothetical protein
VVAIAALLLSIVVFGFSWHQDPAVHLNPSFPGYDGDFDPKIAAADGTGDAYVTWDSTAGVILASATAGGVWTIGWPALTSSTAADAADISVNTNGDYVLVGHFAEISPYDAKLKASMYVGGTGQGTIDVSTNIPALVGNWSPKTAISENGDALVVWVYPAGGQLLSRMYRGGTWQTEFVVDTSVPESVDLDVAADANGNFIVVWKGSETGETANIYARRYVNGSWATRELVGQGSGGTDSYPRVGMYDTGKALVVWQHFATSRYRIAARIYNASTWSSQQLVDPGTTGAYYRTPHIAVQSDGKATIAFFEGTSSPSGWGTVYANNLVSGVWLGPVDISCGNVSRSMSVDMDGHGNAVAAFMVSGYYVYMGYQEGLGWLGCSGQGWNFESGVGTFLANQIEKKIALTPHDIFATYWASVSGDIRMYGRRARKDVYINDFDPSTESNFVDLSITLPFNTICGDIAPYAFQEMRFSNDGSNWSVWEAAPTTAPYTGTKLNWDLTDASYGGTSPAGLKRAYIQFRNANCDSIVTHDEINYDPACIPGTEICDGVDNDCDGEIDEDDAVDAATWYADSDSDGYGDPGNTRPACNQPAGYVSDSTDCDDTRVSVNPGAPEVTCDGLNNDCSAGTVDAPDADSDSYDVCGPGDPANPDGLDADCNDGNAEINPGADEICGDGIDNNCDGNTDDDGVGAPTWYADTDGDGYGDAASAQTACGQPTGYVADNTDCDDPRTAANPGANEVCGDGLDNDCDGNTDDDGIGATTWYADADSDGYGDLAVTQTACSQPSGYVGDGTDCDDGNAAINPGVAEVCGDAVDNNCDGNTDDTGVGAATWYLDADSDGYGDPATFATACSQPAGYVADNTDCDDTSASTNPEAAELCADGVDNDCNALTTDIFDADGDSVDCDLDCDDSNASIGICNTPTSDNSVTVDEPGASVTYPNVTTPGETTITVESCNLSNPDGFVLPPTADPQCVAVDTTAGWDGLVEVCIEYDDTGMTPAEEQDIKMFRFDPGETPPYAQLPLAPPPPGGTNPDIDANIVCALTDHFSDFAPGFALDSDSDGVSDLLDNCPSTLNFFQLDADKDGYGDACDCGSDDPYRYPGGPEFCDGVDNDCDTVVDESCLAACDSPSETGVQLPVSDTSMDAGYPSVVWTGTEYGVAWHDNRDGNWEIYFARLDASGVLIGSEVRVTNDSAISGGPSLVWTGTEYAVAWRDERDGPAEIYFARIDASGSKVGSDVRVTNDSGYSSSPSLVWTGHEYGVAWHDDRDEVTDPNTEIYFARLHWSGNKIGSDQRLSNALGLSEYASLVWTGTEYAVSWHDGQYGDSEILLARIDSLGHEIGTERRVTNSAGGSEMSSIVWTGTTFGATWHDSRDGNWEIYFARLLSDGSRIGSDLRITNDTATSGYPDLIWTGGDFGIFWHDNRSGTWELFQAVINPEGVKVGGDAALTNDPAGSYAVSAKWTGTEYGLAWHDDREGNFEIYFTRAACCADLDSDGVNSCAVDCDDADPNTYPGAPEINDGVDNQCPGDLGYGVIDETSGDSGFHAAGDKTEYSWPAQSGATLYEVARASSADFSTECSTVQTAVAYWIDTAEPSSGGCYYYLNRPLAPYVGSWGQDSAGAERTGICP